MNAIKKLIIENFQSHRHTVVDFAPSGQLTIIIGRSRSGKTAIIRALRWLLYNDPRGVSVPSKSGSQDANNANGNEKSGYCRVGASFIRVIAEMGSGHTVIRERTAATNRYKIIAPGATEPITFEGFGDNVPLEVQELTGVRPIRIDDKNVNLNLSEQLDGPFLGSKSMSAPARAKVLGKLAGTEEIDLASKQLGTDLFRRGQDEKRLSENLKELNEKIGKYDYLPDTKRCIDTQEQLVAKIKAAQIRRDDLSGLKERMHKIETACLKCQEVLQRWNCLDAALPLLSEIDIAQERNTKISKLHDQFSNLNDFVCREQNTIHFWRNVNNAAKAVGAAEADRQRMMELEWQCGRLVEIGDAIADCHGTIDAWWGVEQAEMSVMNIAATIERRRQAIWLHESFLKAEISIDGAQNVLAKLQDIEKAESITKNAKSMADRRHTAYSLHGSYRSITQKINTEKATLDRLAGINKAGELLSLIPTMGERRSAFCSFMARAIETESLVKKTRENAVVWENRVAELQGAYQDELVMMGVCPMCGNNIDPKKLKEAC